MSRRLTTSPSPKPLQTAALSCPSSLIFSSLLFEHSFQPLRRTACRVSRINPRLIFFYIYCVFPPSIDPFPISFVSVVLLSLVDLRWCQTLARRRLLRRKPLLLPREAVRLPHLPKLLLLSLKTLIRLLIEYRSFKFPIGLVPVSFALILSPEISGLQVY